MELVARPAWHQWAWFAALESQVAALTTTPIPPRQQHQHRVCSAISILFETLYPEFRGKRRDVTCIPTIFTQTMTSQRFHKRFLPKSDYFKSDYDYYS